MFYCSECDQTTGVKRQSSDKATKAIKKPKVSLPPLEIPEYVPQEAEDKTPQEQKEDNNSPIKTKETAEEKTEQEETEEKIGFVCSECHAEFKKKFKHNKHIYVAHNRSSQQLDEIIKIAEKHGQDQAEQCDCPIVMICID